jgi:hypothetical protein
MRDVVQSILDDLVPGDRQRPSVMNVSVAAVALGVLVTRDVDGGATTT